MDQEKRRHLQDAIERLEREIEEKKRLITKIDDMVIKLDNDELEAIQMDKIR